jgi:hypothetical protein
LAAIASQLPKPVAQLASEHAPAAHATVALAKVQAVAQVPQWVTVVRVSVSQPLSAMPSQSPKPAMQVNPHAPAAQVVVALARVGQAFPHAPQCARLVAVSVSQPLAAIMSQLAVAPGQPVTVHRPATQSAVPLAAVQAIPQPPQWARLVCGSTHAPPQHD